MLLVAVAVVRHVRQGVRVGAVGLAGVQVGRGVGKKHRDAVLGE